MTELPGALLDQAATAALAAELERARTERRPVFLIPEHGQVKRLIAAAWPVLTAGAGDSDA